jgi:beta-carotene ketolase (CrtO type)
LRDYDVVIAGGGINGLTVAAYLAKAGLSVGVFEARGQCGAHCDTIELGAAGFLHNLHAAWLVPALSPAMADLELERFGLDLRGTDAQFAKTFRDGTNVVYNMDGALTEANVTRVAARDWELQNRITQYAVEHADDALRLNRDLTFGPAKPELLGELARFHDGWLAELGIPLRGAELMRMTGLEVLEMLFESEEYRTTMAAFAEFTGQWPVRRGTGARVLGGGGGFSTAVHTARGGSHELTHALVQCVLAYGGDIWTTCPVERIIVEDGRAQGIRLSPDALFPGEEIRARAVVSNLSLVPTFLGLLGEEVIGPGWARTIEAFNYDEPLLLGVFYALSGDPEFASAAHDPGVQRSWVGYFGGETLAEMRSGFGDLITGVIPDDVMAGWFLPTRADPTQAPPGCHTSYTWISVPPCPRLWRGQRLSGWDAWPGLAEPLAEAVTDRFEEYAPGFKDLVIERHVMTPMDQERNNPSAIRGNMIGGSAIPEQSDENRPLPGILKGGAARSFVPGLYLSNSIQPYGATHLGSGCVAANEVAEDFGCRDMPWWTAKPMEWFWENVGRIPLNLGVNPKWTVGAGAEGTP